MSRLFAKLARQVPAVRRVLDERKRYAEEVARLAAEVTALNGRNAALKDERDSHATQVTRLDAEIASLRPEVAHLSAELGAAGTAWRALVDERDSLESENVRLMQAANAATLRRKRAKRLHVVGYARSGTTILMDILNSSPDMFVFSELNLHALRHYPDLFAGYGGAGFVEHFDARKKFELKARYKGAIAPRTAAEYDTPDEYIDAIGEDYRYVGDKIATGCRLMEGVPDIDLLRTFVETEERAGATMLFTMRRPGENLQSVLKMFPDADADEWGRSIAQTMVLVLEAFLAGNRSALVFHQDIAPPLIAELSTMLEIELPMSHTLVGSVYRTKHELEVDEASARVAVLNSAYERLYGLYACDGGPLKRSKTDLLVKQVADVIAELETQC